MNAQDKAAAARAEKAAARALDNAKSNEDWLAAAALYLLRKS